MVREGERRGSGEGWKLHRTRSFRDWRGHDKEFRFYSKSKKKLAECSQNLICVFKAYFGCLGLQPY